MKRYMSVLMILALCLSMCACSSSSEEKETDSEEKVASSSEDEAPNVMPEFSTVDLEGNEVTSDIFAQADLTVVNFWATYCSPCINELPDLEEWSESMPDNVQIIGIVVDVESEDSEEYSSAQQIVDATGVTYQNLVAAGEFDEMISEMIGVPTTYFVDREGNLVGNSIIGANVSGYKKYVEEYMNESE